MMDWNKIQIEMTKASQYMMIRWNVKQNDKSDKDTRFIYKAESLDEVIRLSELNGVDVLYSVKRWFNYMSAMFSEYVFEKYGAIKESNKYHKTIDFYVNDIGFDLKNTTLSESFAKRGYYEYNFEEYIEWLYVNQSTEGRYHTSNRIFIVFAYKNDLSKSILLKSRFDLIETAVKEYMENIEFTEFNINGDVLYSHIIPIEL